MIIWYLPVSLIAESRISPLTELYGVLLEKYLYGHPVFQKQYDDITDCIVHSVINDDSSFIMITGIFKLALVLTDDQFLQLTKL